MRDDPCLSCTLPDCDDRSPKCAIRLLYNSYHRKLRAKRHDLITDAERQAWNDRFHDWYLDRCAEAADGIRPYKRWEQEKARRREAHHA